MRRNSRRDRCICLAGSVLAVFLGCQASAGQVRYKAIDLNHSEPFGTVVLATDAGRASGFAIDAYPLRNTTHYCRRAVYWPSVTGSPVRPKGFNSPCSDVRGMSGTRLVGAMREPVHGGYSHAILFDASEGTSRDLNTAGFADSLANGIRGDEIVGQASGTATGGHVHAIIWQLGKSTVVDLNGPNHLESAAVATSGNQETGWASDKYGENVHAMLWSAKHHAEIDLNPELFDGSYAYAIDAGAQVGVGIEHDSAHALLWHGRAAGVVDLNPAGFVESYATAVSGNRQIGFAIKPDLSAHAVLWSGNAASYTDLQTFLPPHLTQSYATSIDVSGDVGGYATDAAGMPHAVLWRPIPVKTSPPGRFASTEK